MGDQRKAGFGFPPSPGKGPEPQGRETKPRGDLPHQCGLDSHIQSHKPGFHLESLLLAGDALKHWFSTRPEGSFMVYGGVKV